MVDLSKPWQRWLDQLMDVLATSPYYAYFDFDDAWHPASGLQPLRLSNTGIETPEPGAHTASPADVRQAAASTPPAA